MSADRQTGICAEEDCVRLWNEDKVAGGGQMIMEIEWGPGSIWSATTVMLPDAPEMTD